MTEFIFITKGILAGLGVVLLVMHMTRTGPTVTNPAQRARYIVLLGYGVLSASATVEQLAEDTPLSARHVGGLILAGALVWVAWYSMHVERKRA